MIKEIKQNGELLAIIIPRTYRKPGISFLTSDELSQQMAYMEHPAGYEIAAHIHNPVKRAVVYTRETLIIRKGKLRVDFYTESEEYIESCILYGGDVILLINGGHGFFVLEDVEMIEVKQGPYAGDGDKKRFRAVESEKITIIEDKDYLEGISC